MHKFGTLSEGVALEYFTTALGDALTPEAGQAWAKFMDLMIEVVTDTAKGEISVIIAFRECEKRNPTKKYSCKNSVSYIFRFFYKILFRLWHKAQTVSTILVFLYLKEYF